MPSKIKQRLGNSDEPSCTVPQYSKSTTVHTVPEQGELAWHGAVAMPSSVMHEHAGRARGTIAEAQPVTVYFGSGLHSSVSQREQTEPAVFSMSGELGG